MSNQENAMDFNEQVGNVVTFKKQEAIQASVCYAPPIIVAQVAEPIIIMPADESDKK
jgi:hypothetical protein